MKHRSLRTNIYKDRKDEFRWVTFAGNNKTVGAATEGFKNLGDCEKNAKMNGARKIKKDF